MQLILDRHSHKPEKNISFIDKKLAKNIIAV